MNFWFGKSQTAAPKTEEAPKQTEASVSPVPAASQPVAEVKEEPQPVAPAPVVEEPAAPEVAEKSEPVEPEPVKAEAPAPAPSTPAPAQAQPNPRELYYLLMNALYDAVLILDGTGHVVDCNERVTHVLGYDRGDMWDMPIETIVKGIGPVVFKQLKEALLNDQQVLISAKCTRKDGSTFQCEVSANLMRMKIGENFVLLIRNIEKRVAEIKARLLESMQTAKPASDSEAGPAPARRVLKVVRKADA